MLRTKHILFIRRFYFGVLLRGFRQVIAQNRTLCHHLASNMMHMISISIYYNIYVHISHHIPGTSLFIKYQYHQCFMTQALTLLVDLHVGKRRKHQESATTLGSFEALPAAASQV